MMCNCRRGAVEQCKISFDDQHGKAHAYIVVEQIELIPYMSNESFQTCLTRNASHVVLYLPLSCYCLAAWLVYRQQLGQKKLQQQIQRASLPKATADRPKLCGRPKHEPMHTSFIAEVLAKILGTVSWHGQKPHASVDFGRRICRPSDKPRGSSLRFNCIDPKLEHFLETFSLVQFPVFNDTSKEELAAACWHEGANSTKNCCATVAQKSFSMHNFSMS
jgi:hypothetical protein